MLSMLSQGGEPSDTSSKLVTQQRLKQHCCHLCMGQICSPLLPKACLRAHLVWLQLRKELFRMSMRMRGCLLPLGLSSKQCLNGAGDTSKNTILWVTATDVVPQVGPALNFLTYRPMRHRTRLGCFALKF